MNRDHKETIKPDCSYVSIYTGLVWKRRRRGLSSPFQRQPEAVESGIESAPVDFYVMLRTGERLPVRADMSMLAALRASGVRVESMCESGWCGTCEVGVTDGMKDVIHNDMIFTREERVAGSPEVMFPCVSRAHAGSVIGVDLS